MKHNKRMFSQIKTDKILTKRDIKKGFELFEKQKEDETDLDTPPPANMFI